MTLREKMLAVMADVNAEVAERDELIELIAIALLTRSNLFVLGAPGQAKSASINAFRARIEGARQFERLLSKQTDEEQLFGRLDLSSLIPGSVPEATLKKDAVYQDLQAKLDAAIRDFSQAPGDANVHAQLHAATARLEDYRKAVAALHPPAPMVNTAGKLPEADIVLLDEIFKCNDGVLNSLLTALNERKYTNEGCTYRIPAISFFAASNEIPNFNDPQEKLLEALYDRLQLKLVTENISERTARLAVLRQKQRGTAGHRAAAITLDELLQMQTEVNAVEVPEPINELADDILCELRKSGVTISDRKFLGFSPIAQAKAWLSGRTRVECGDLLALRHYLWRLPADRTVVDATLHRLCVNPLQSKVDELRSMALEAQSDFEQTHGSAKNHSALIKLQGELVRLFRQQQKYAAAAQSDAERALTANLLTELEQIGRKAYDTEGFTYTSLEQLAALR